MKIILGIIFLSLTSSIVMAEIGVGDAFDISCTDKKRFTVTASGGKQIHDRGPTNRYTSDGSIQCEVGGNKFKFSYMVREPTGHGACGGSPMLYFDLYLNEELKAKFHKFGSYCFNSVKNIDVYLNSAGLPSMKLCGETALSKDNASFSIDSCLSILLKDYARISFDANKDHISQIINFKTLAKPDEQLQKCLSEKANYTTSGMTNCTNNAAKNWDKELNHVYKKLMSKLTPEGRESLKQSQRQWIKFRDRESQFIAEIYNRKEFSGTMYIPMKSMDFLQVTKKRTLELAKYLGKHK